MLEKLSSSARTRELIARHPVGTYFLLAYALSWSVGALLIAAHNDLLAVPGTLHYLVSFGPAMAAVTVTALTSGRRGLYDLLTRLTRWRIRWVLVGLLSPLALAGIAALTGYLLTGNRPDLASLGQVAYLGDIGVAAALLLWIATFGFGEELGWRGFALHRMQAKQGALSASIVIGILWALWHLPAFFYKPNFIALGPGGFLGFTLGVISGSILLTWLYNRSGGSVLVVALWHAMFDFTTSTSAAEGTVAAITSALVIAWAVAVAAYELWTTGRAKKRAAPAANAARLSNEGIVR